MDLKSFIQFKKLDASGAFHEEEIPSGDPEQLPRTVYMFWDKGIDAAPDLVRFSVESWRLLNPKWSLVVLDDETAGQFIDRASLPPGITPSHYANLLRTRLMAKLGGVWADATLLCLRPLDDWLPGIFNQTDFFAFARPGPDRVISNWFLASRRYGDIVTQWYAASQGFWASDFPTKRPYYWHHYIFEHLLRTDASFRREFERTPRLSAEPPHLLQRSLAAGRVSDTDMSRIRHTAVQKLNHKASATAREVEQVIRRLDVPLAEQLRHIS